ncbi:MAG: hypothetical protein JNK33_06550 [Candidatus Doudnabacteria bacterium]|nr:hypothetical protein [Candidatus Doudnabacteria bacterium]
MYVIKLLVVIYIAFASSVAVGDAATLPPKSGVGGLPHREPLQALPQGVGANISNNIQQTEGSDPPASATTVAPIDQSVEAGEAGEVGAKVSPPETDLSPGLSGLLRGVLWILVVVGMVGFIAWLRRAVNKRES